MEEFDLMALIASGENSYVDFKRLLELDSAAGKAEFIKDVIALANGAKTNAYLLIGVDNDKKIVGIDELAEERIQQIIHKYITPPVKIECSVLKLNDFKVGVIVIQGNIRPHKVATDIEKLYQNDVFIRRGTIITRASPEEIINMGRISPESTRQVEQYEKAAQTYFQLKDWEQSIYYYSKIIDLMPSVHFLLQRGVVYENMAKRQAIHFKKLLSTLHYTTFSKRLVDDPNSPKNLGEKSFNDYSAAIILAVKENDIEIQIEARLGRARVHDYLYDTGESAKEFYKIRSNDLDWLKTNSKRAKLGEALFLEINSQDWEFNKDVTEEALQTISEAIRIGFNQPIAYRLRARIHSFAHNYGLALQDYNRAIDSYQDQETDEFLSSCYHERALILLDMGRYTDAYINIAKSENINKNLAANSTENYWGDYLLINILAKLGIARIQGQKFNTFWILVAKLFTLYLSNRSFEMQISINPSKDDVYKLRQKDFPEELLHSLHLLINDKN